MSLSPSSSEDRSFKRFKLEDVHTYNFDVKAKGWAYLTLKLNVKLKDVHT